MKAAYASKGVRLANNASFFDLKGIRLIILNATETIFVKNVKKITNTAYSTYGFVSNRIKTCKSQASTYSTWSTTQSKQKTNKNRLIVFSTYVHTSIR